MKTKLDIYQKCMLMLDEKIEMAESSMKAAQDSANTEEKSTAGDKHDVARAMSHIERDMYAKQLSESISQKKILLSINPENPQNKVASGALVITDRAGYFISIALGKVGVLNSKDVFAISPVSPIGQKMMDLIVYDNFQVGNTVQVIEGIE